MKNYKLLLVSALIVGAFHARALADNNSIEFYFECSEVSLGCIEVPYTGLAEASLKIKKEPEMRASQKDVEHAEIQKDRRGRPEVMLELRQDAKEKFAKLTSDNIGKRLVIVVAGKAMLAAVIRMPIPGGRLQISEASGKDDHFLESLPWLKTMSDESRTSERFWRLFSISAYIVLGVLVLFGSVYFAFVKIKIRKK